MERDARAVYTTLRAGGLALLPTAVGYGLVAMEADAVRRIYELKGRPASKPCVTVTTPAITAQVALPLASTIVDWLAEITRTTPLAVVAPLDPKSPLCSSQSEYVREQTTLAGTVALLYSAGELVERVATLAYADGRLVVGSSANASGTGNNYALDKVPAEMRGRADLVIDHGPTRLDAERRASTILDITQDRFVREGINFERIARSWAALTA
jgi:tRNA A37 threonylcarbamoyladenosine synthetase subunit TsaC/SUA5/YrdC